MLLSTQLLRKRVKYNPKTGSILPRKLGPRGGLGMWRDAHGYLRIDIAGTGKRGFLAHRIAWQLYYGQPPSRDIDHANGIVDDNRIANLRLATASQNNANARKRKDNTTGFKGVCFHKTTGRWCAYIQCRKSRYHLGLFDTPEEAHEEYCAAARDYFGRFMRAG